MITTIRSSNRSLYGTHQCQNVVVPARIRSHGSDLTSRRSLLVYRHHFRSTLYVFTEVSHTSHSLIPYTGHHCSPPDPCSRHLDPCFYQSFHRILSFSLTHQASRVRRCLGYPVPCSYLWAVGTPGRGNGH
jgi:hypothetical protein